MISHSYNMPVPLQSPFFHFFYHIFPPIHSSLYFFIGALCSLGTLQLLLIKSISTASNFTQRCVLCRCCTCCKVLWILWGHVLHSGSETGSPGHLATSIRRYL
jgi:hypothetical protein